LPKAGVVEEDLVDHLRISSLYDLSTVKAAQILERLSELERKLDRALILPPRK